MTIWASPGAFLLACIVAVQALSLPLEMLRANPSGQVQKTQSAGAHLEGLTSIHTIIYNRTFNTDHMVVGVYKPTSFQYSPGEYVAFTTSSNDQFTFTPSTFYLNNLGFPYSEAGDSLPEDGIIRLATSVVEDKGANGWGGVVIKAPKNVCFVCVNA